jgi:pimeloyl-ACP methyl ester carboxylesterase
MPSILANGITLVYTQAGDPDAPPMVLLHGGGNNKSSWDGVLPALAKTHDVYALDLRGHGESARPGEYSFELMRDDVLAFIDALGLDRIVLIGHSMGGTVAWMFAPDHLDRLTHLVVEDTAPNRPGDPRIDIMPRPEEPLPYDYDALAAVLGQLNNPDPAWTSRLAEITTPTLIVAGGPDSHVNQGRLAELAAALPDARLVTIPVGHRVHAEAPDEFLGAVTDFLAG